MNRIKISSDIECIQPSPSNRGVTCSGIIIHSHPQIIIDICLGEKKTRELLEGLDPEIAIITHFHIDHSGMLSTILSNTKASIFIPKGEDKYLTRIQNYSGQIAPDNPQIQKEFEQILINSGYQNLKGYQLYNDLADLDLPGNTHMQVIETPGHSPNHKSFYFPGEKILFSGDIGLDAFGPWYAFPNCNLLDHIDSILRLMALDVEVIITSHSGIISKDANSAFKGCLKIICDRETMIAQKLEKGYSLSQIVSEGIIFEEKARFKEPLRSMRYSGDETAFDHHWQLLENGGILKHFPQLNTMLQG